VRSLLEAAPPDVDAPSSLGEMGEQLVALLFGERIEPRHDTTKPFDIGKRKRSRQAGLSRISKHRLQRAVDHAADRLFPKSSLGSESHAELLQVIERHDCGRRRVRPKRAVEADETASASNHVGVVGYPPALRASTIRSRGRRAQMGLRGKGAFSVSGD
jgi:hypothetical protein